MRSLRSSLSVRLDKPLLVKAFLVYGLAMDSDVFARVFAGISSSPGGQSSFLHSDNSNPILFGFTALFMLWALSLLLPVYRQVVKLLLSVPWFTAIYLESLASIVWSVDRTATFRYGITLWAYMLCGLIASLYLSTAQIIRLIGNTVFALAVISVPSQYIYPQDALAPGWTGVYGEKNHLGIGMTIGLIALLTPQVKWTFFRAFKVTFLCVMLMLSQSGTAIVCTVIIIAFLLYLRSAPKARHLGAATVGGIALIAILFVPDFLDRILALGGKNTTLTGRDVIWNLSIHQWARKPILGWGYSAFWGAEDALVQQTLYWNPGHSHNGFLEVGLALGIVGVLIIFGILFSTLRLALSVRKNVSELAGTWLLCSIVMLILHDMTEVDFLLPAPLWFVLTVVYFTTLRDQREALTMHAGEREQPWNKARALPYGALMPATESLLPRQQGALPL